MTRNLYQTDVTANNLANINTTGFKRDDSFTDWFMEAVELGSAQRYTTFAQGTLRTTDNPLDLALTSQGFFTLETPSGIAFTRNGHFSVSEDGFIITGQGYRVLGERGPLSVTGVDGAMGDLEIAINGEIYVDGIPNGFLDIANIVDLRTLEKVGGNLYRMTDDALVTRLSPEQIHVQQGMLEGSNVDPVSEMIDLIDYQRQFESTQRVVRAMDSLLGRAVQISEYR
ncbi:flagellar hook-basal body protein [Candidatus Neomarinimicrobiota bacterium]